MSNDIALQAIDLVKYLSSSDVQKQNAILGSKLPTVIALYDDADVVPPNM